jgi:hypothetical protein
VVRLQPDALERGSPFFFSASARAASTTTAVTAPGWKIIIVQSHAPLSWSLKSAMSGTHHSPSSGATENSTPLALSANLMV